MTKKDDSQVDLTDRPAPHPLRRQVAADGLISDLVGSMWLHLLHAILVGSM